ncbi:glycoside hydrolase superfamily [Aspergillus venezuelensis]
MGCGRLDRGQRICVSECNPPMPASVEKTICGPQVPETERPTDGTKRDDLSPCPLNFCCNIWGQCGTTEDFCIDTSIRETPVTAENNTNGCISNCGMDIVNDYEPPENFIQVAYFEAWNGNRPCLHMDVTNVRRPYTHIHFAFGDISEDFVPCDNGIEEQFAKFVGMTGFGLKRTISFDGWAFSNEPGTNRIIRQGVKPENRERFRDNIVKFVVYNNLDGSDPGTPEDGPNYLEFLKLIADVVDYIVYMTYDLHGQWDVGNEWATSGCSEGNCLRSHINLTETMGALAMVTKAGIPANKLIIGVSSYGRSFKMTEAGCTGVMCRYLGERNQSPAMPGECTETGGYIADAEINKIKRLGEREWKEWHGEDSDSTIFVYNDVEWVAYMDSDAKKGRLKAYRNLNFGGTSDWAVDLQNNYSDEVYETPEMECNAPCTIVPPPSQVPETITITVDPSTTSVQIEGTTTTITVTPEPLTVQTISFWNMHKSRHGHRIYAR